MSYIIYKNIFKLLISSILQKESQTDYSVPLRFTVRFAGSINRWIVWTSALLAAPWCVKYIHCFVAWTQVCVGYTMLNQCLRWIRHLKPQFWIRLAFLLFHPAFSWVKHKKRVGHITMCPNSSPTFWAHLSGPFESNRDLGTNWQFNMENHCFISWIIYICIYIQ